MSGCVKVDRELLKLAVMALTSSHNLLVTDRPDLCSLPDDVSWTTNHTDVCNELLACLGESGESCKPEADNWSDAPEWAEYIATDKNGASFYYEKEPFANEYIEKWLISCTENKCTKIQPVCIESWQQSIQKRPTK
jgi:hypothetical protein